MPGSAKISLRASEIMISIKIDQKQIRDLKKKLNSISPKVRNGVMFLAVQDAVTATEKYGQEQVLSGQVLKPRTGALRRSFQSIVKQDNGDIYGLVGSGVRSGGKATFNGKRWSATGRLPYAEIHETGGVIHAKPGGWLTIPTDANKTPAGVMRYTYGEWKAKVKGMKRGSKKQMFYFVKKVTIPARRYMTKIALGMQNRVVNIMLDRIRREVTK
jgi:hypothetical protein